MKVIEEAVSDSKYVPQAGDIIWLNFDPQAGHEQSGRRPALVLSPIEYNRKVGLCIVCPVTNEEKGYSFEVRLPRKCEVTGVILADHVKNLDWQERKAEFVCKIPEDIFADVLLKIKALIFD